MADPLLIGIDSQKIEIFDAENGNVISTSDLPSDFGGVSIGGEAVLDGHFFFNGLRSGKNYMFDYDIGKDQIVNMFPSESTNFVADAETHQLIGLYGTYVASVSTTADKRTVITSISGILGGYLGAEAAGNGHFYFTGYNGGPTYYNVDLNTGSFIQNSANPPKNFVGTGRIDDIAGVDSGVVYSVVGADGAIVPIESISGFNGVFLGAEATENGHFFFKGTSTTGDHFYDVNIVDGAISVSDFGINNFVSLPVCFCQGTNIRTVNGNVAVEHLRIGDVVVTASGELRAIRWLGHRTVKFHRNCSTDDALPVLICAHAFGKNKPSRNLLVSQGHSICINILGDLLVPAGQLVNGVNIQILEVDQITYWHVELETHDIIFAEDLECESYLDIGNRRFFIENDITNADTLHLEDASRVSMMACRPIVVDKSITTAIKNRMNQITFHTNRHDKIFRDCAHISGISTCEKIVAPSAERRAQSGKKPSGLDP